MIASAVGWFVGIMLYIYYATKPLFDLFSVTARGRLLSGVILLSTLAPRIGEFALSHPLGVDRVQRWFDNDIAEDMTKMRRDLRRMYVENTDVKEDAPTKGELLADIKRTHSDLRRRHAIGEVLIGVGVGLIAIVISTVSVLASIGLLISVYSVVFTLSMLLRGFVVDTLAYSVEWVDEDAEMVRRPPRLATLGFMRGWNLMLLKNEANIHRLILLSLLRGEFVLGFELGEDLIEDVMKGEKEMDEAMDDLIEQEMGGSSMESRMMRSVIRRFFGV